MIKCIAWDLDNTIWDGIADEEGHLELRPKIEELLKILNNSGVVNAIVSKNTQSVVEKKLEDFKIKDYFLITSANWKRKYSNIAKLSKELNISLDSILFVDDSEFELQEAKYHLPDIHILNSKQYMEIYDLVKASCSRTKESKARNYIYQILKKRKKDEKDYFGSKKDFLLDCNIRITFRNAIYSDVSRIYELSMRTNQFNINHYKVQEVDIIRFIDSERFIVKVCELEDRYADYGTVGMAIMEKCADRLLILHFAVSCKVEGRGVGKCFLTYLLNHALSSNYAKLSSRCVFGEKNSEMKFLFSNLGFEEENITGVMFTKYLSEQIPYDVWLKVREIGNSISSNVRYILRELVSDVDNLGEHDDLLENSIIDSITAISLISALEERFDISIEFEELKMINFSTIFKITSFVEDKLEKKESIK